MSTETKENKVSKILNGTISILLHLLLYFILFLVIRHIVTLEWGINDQFFKVPVKFIVPTFGLSNYSILIEYQVNDIINFFSLLFLLLTIISRFPVTQAMIMNGYDNNVPRSEQSEFENGFSFRALNAHLSSYSAFSIFASFALFARIGYVDGQFFGKSILIYFFSRLIYHISCLLNFQILETISSSICFVTLTNLVGTLCFVVTLVFKKFE
eukprot:gene10195-2614_t